MVENEYGKCGHLSFFTSQQNIPDVDIDSRYRPISTICDSENYKEGVQDIRESG